MPSYLVMRLQSFGSLEVDMPQIGKVRLPDTSHGPLIGFMAVYSSYDEALKHAKDPNLVREIQLFNTPPISATRKN